MSSQIPPPGWLEDFLSQFLQDTHNNSFYVFHHHKALFNLFSEVCEIYEIVGDHITKPEGQDELAALLFFNMARSSYYASLRIISGGQLPETYVLLRQCLENSLMGFYFYHELQRPEGYDRFKLWLSRNESEENKKKVRNTFTSGELKKRLKEREQELGEIVNSLYEITIDSGAHPNESALTSNLRFSKEDQRRMMHQSWVIDFEKQWVPFLKCVKIVIEMGISSLCIFQSIFKEKFKLLGVSDKIEGLKRKYPNILKQNQK